MVAPVTSGLLFDLTAQGIPDGTQLTTWSDVSGAGNHAPFQSGDEYAWVRAGVTDKGGPAVHFTNQGYAFTNQALFDGATSAEFFAVVRTDGTSDNPGFYQFGGGDRNYFPWVDGNVYDGSFTTTRYSFPAVSPTNWHIYNVSHDGTQRVATIDGVVVHSATVPFANPNTVGAYSFMRIGHQFSNAGWHGDIAEMLAYNRALSPSERARVMAYLKAQHFAAGGNLDVPPISVGVGAGAAQPSSPMDRLAVPAISVGVAVHGSIYIPVDNLDVPAIAVGLTLPGAVIAAGQSTLVLSAPGDADTVATSQPQFMVGVDVDDDTVDYSVEVQYDDNSDFTHPVILSAAMAGSDGGALLSPTAAVPTVTFWRARLLGSDGAEVISWSLPFSFTVSTLTSAAGLPITWKVAAGAARPVHVWHFDPPGAVAGEAVTVYGQGFPATGQVLVGDDPVVVSAWTRVPATSVTDDTRVIAGDLIDCEHYAVTFTAPTVDGPGDALTVEA